MRSSQFFSDFAHILTPEEMEKLAVAYGGTVLRIRKTGYSDDDALVKLLGREAVDALVQESEGEYITVPLTEARRAKVKAIITSEPKVTYREIALRLGIHVRSVYRIMEEQADDRQFGLPL